MKSKLPSKPSALIKAALKDLAKIERSKKYVVDMGYWHVTDESKKNAKCQVCLGGSVLVKTLKVPLKQKFGHGTIEEMGSEVSSKIFALDQFRRGNIGKALDYLGLYKVATKYSKKYNGDFHYVPDYDEKKEFKAALLKIAANLKKIGY